MPTIRLGDLSAAQKRAYLIADNRLAELSGWDEELLAIELQTLTTIDLDFDIEITGFETAEIDTLIAGLNGAGNGSAGTGCCVRMRPGRPPMTTCWTARSPRWSSPTRPTTYPSTATSAAEAVRVMAAGEMSEAEFTAFLKTVLRQLALHSRDGALHFVCMDAR